MLHMGEAGATELVEEAMPVAVWGGNGSCFSGGEGGTGLRGKGGSGVRLQVRQEVF